jgi:hypothetical protein
MDGILTTPQMVVEDRGFHRLECEDMRCPGKLTIIN